MLLQVLQEKVCEFQARLCSEDATKRLLLQQLQTQEAHQDQTDQQDQAELGQEHQYSIRETLEPPSLQENPLRQAYSNTGELGNLEK